MLKTDILPGLKVRISLVGKKVEVAVFHSEYHVNYYMLSPAEFLEHVNTTKF